MPPPPETLRSPSDVLAHRFREDCGHVFALLREQLSAAADAAPDVDASGHALGQWLFARFVGAAGRPALVAPPGQDDAGNGVETAARALLGGYTFTPFEAGDPYAPPPSSAPNDAINPELLAAVWEDHVAGRGASGSYYTPRVIVSFLCREALKAYLTAHLGSDRATAVARFVDENEAGALPDPARTLGLLRSVRVVDPACGGGAFLVGTLFELCRLRRALNEAGASDAAQQAAARRREIIAENLFGVDRDAGALTITRRRLWLAQAVAAGTERETDLPTSNALAANLGHGDALSAPPPPYVAEDTHGASSTAAPDAFDWRHGFGGVFDGPNVGDGGFDIVLGNPPYGATIGPVAAQTIRRFYQTTTRDTAAYFLERGLQIARAGRGVVCLIVPKSLGFYPSWHGVRQLLGARARLVATLDAGLAFEAANSEQIAVCYQCGPRANGDDSPSNPPARIYVAEPVRRPTPRKTIRPDGVFPGDLAAVAGVIPFRGLTPAEARDLRTIRDNAVFFDHVYREAFRGLYIPEGEKADLLARGGGPLRYVSRVPDVGRWRVARATAIAVDHSPKYQARAERVLRPRVFLKVLRGNRLVAYPDVDGELLTTEKLVNFVLCDGSRANLLYVAGVLNSVWPSYFLQRVVFSQTTETSRVMDGALARYIPLPARTSDVDRAAIADLAARCLAAEGQNCQAWEQEIDARVGALFGL